MKTEKQTVTLGSLFDDVGAFVLGNIAAQMDEAAPGEREREVA
jgi:hypothetical protein